MRPWLALTGEAYGIDEVHAAYEPLLENPAVDAVVVASATNTDVPIIQAAVEAGKHIFRQKPLALELAARSTPPSRQSDRADVKLQVGLNRRFDANFARVKRHPQWRGRRPHLLHIISRDPAPPPLGLCPRLRRPLPGHDDPRFRYGPLPDGL